MKIEVQNNTVFRDGGREATAITVRALRRFLQGVLKRGRDLWRGKVKVDTGEYRRSIKYRTEQNAKLVKGTIFSDLALVRGLADEEGRKPGGKMPPAGVLLPWMERKGIPPEMEFLVRRKIARDGFPGTHAQAQAFTRIKGLLASAGLGAEIAKDLNRA